MKSSAERKRNERARKRKLGFIPKQIWVKPEQWPELKAFIDNLDFHVDINGLLEDEIEQLKKDKAELVGALREAADDIVEYANSYNNDSSIYVTDAHNEADKYRAIAHAHANED